MAQTFNNGESYESIREKLNDNAGEINALAAKLNYTEAYIKIGYDSVLSEFSVTEISNGFEGVTFSVSNPTGTQISIIPSEGLYVAGKTVFTAMPFSAGSNYWVALEQGDFSPTDRRLRLRKFDQSETTLVGFGNLVVRIQVFE